MRHLIPTLIALAYGSLPTPGLAYPMSGQDTVFTAEAGATLSLTDQGNQTLNLDSGQPYRLRFSTQSSSFHIMPGGNADYEFKVQGGFPGNHLDDFTLPGSSVNNSGVDIIGKTTPSILLGTHTENRSDSCNWVCGTQEVPEQTPIQVCRPGPGGKQICYTEYQTTYVIQNVICYGTVNYNVDVSEFETDFDLTILDASSQNRLGNFHGVAKQWSADGFRQILSSSCPI